MLIYALGSDIPAYVIKQQGRLLSVSGAPTNGTFSVAVRIFESATGGVAAYTQTVENVVGSNGTYSFTFGTNRAEFISAFTNAEAWLELSINGDAFVPRQRFVAAPYVVLAGKTEGEMTGKQLRFSNGSYLMHNGTNLFLISADGITTNQIDK